MIKTGIAALALAVGLPGVPMLFAGDEIGATGLWGWGAALLMMALSNFLLYRYGSVANPSGLVIVGTLFVAACATMWMSLRQSHRPDVEVVYSEGRNFISRTDKKFDTIFLGFVDSWASVASGGLSLSENYLYTTQAFRAYFDHLNDNGVLVILRWDSDIPRLVANSVALLGAEGASQRVAAILEKRGSKADPPQMLFMLRKRPFTPAEADGSGPRPIRVQDTGGDDHDVRRKDPGRQARGAPHQPGPRP